MEKELNEKDVYEYGDVLAEVFGERKIFAHRAVGLEALLCQYMHQMLAKQHQLKIMKKAGKDIQNHYKKHRLQNKDDFHCYDALAVQLEASRLSLEATYDDIFASQHRILAQLKQVGSGGNITNYSIPSPYAKPPQQHQRPNLQISTKHPIEEEDDKLIPATPSMGDDTSAADLEAALDILSINSGQDIQDGVSSVPIASPNVTTSAQAKKVTPDPRHNTPTARTVTARSSTDSNSITSPTKRVNDSGKSARERRREIEQKRLAKPSSNRFTVEDDASPKARDRMRELEAKAMGRLDGSSLSLSLSGHMDDANNAGNGTKIDEELKERSQRVSPRRKVPSN